MFKYTSPIDGNLCDPNLTFYEGQVSWMLLPLSYWFIGCSIMYMRAANKCHKWYIGYVLKHHLFLHLSCFLFVKIISTDVDTCTSSIYQSTINSSIKIFGLLFKANFHFVFTVLSFVKHLPPRWVFSEPPRVKLSELKWGYEVDVPEDPFDKVVKPLLWAHEVMG